jgi:hypothetical protein
MPSSTFETLPNEILMIIIRNSGDIFTIFQAFFGLNQRINNILVDKRTHLLTDFLFLNSSDVSIDDYYNSNSFHDVSEQLLSLKPTENAQQLRQCLESLVAFHIQRKYQQSTDELELGLAHVQSIRMHLTDDELQKIDMELKEIFNDLPNSSKPMKNIKQIQSLVLTKGARLECTDSEYGNFNLADAVNKLLLDMIDNNDQSKSQYFINSLVKMFKTLIISNLSLLHNQSYVVNGGCVIYFFLFHVIYKCQNFNSYKPPLFINIQYYRATVDLLLFALQCLYYEQVVESWWISHFSELLNFISPVKLRIDQEIFVYTSQSEILKILFDENILNPTITDFNSSHTYSQYLGNLFICNRFDLVSTIFHHNEHVRDAFENCWDDPKFVGILTGDSIRRRVFQSVLDDASIETWLATTTNLLFILLQKRECRYVKKLFNLSPSLIDRLDTDGNDPLLYVCLKVRGCRQRLIEYLLKIGCDGQRRNSHGENFLDALQLERNRNLLKKLIEQETIEIDDDSGEIKINAIK